ncbi:MULTISPECIES: hypothetical protein [unclassified Paenibacillus]|uniref:hypothetical protein n=1 Tax=Paenibacillus TaxID=44249 RepID=UPI00096E80D7|nr:MULTISPECIES: hypothetical protein [unclassified Paenibacillus]OMC71107.1 hypothetical protein BK126_03060 [Paenibacillus sp. FSL H7-0326]
MSKQEKLISADKLLEWIKEKKANGSTISEYSLSRAIKCKELDPDPVPTIKPGDKVKCFGIIEYVTVMRVENDQVTIRDGEGGHHTVTIDDLEVVKDE